MDPSDKAIGKATEVVRTLAARSDQTYDLALAILFLSRVQPGSRGPHDDLIQRLGRRLAGGGPAGIWDYNVPLDERRIDEGSSDKTGADDREETAELAVAPRPRSSDGDNSNTQFALLGIWAAGRHGFESNDALEAIDGHFRETQNYPGRWGYKPGMAGSERDDLRGADGPGDRGGPAQAGRALFGACPRRGAGGRSRVRVGPEVPWRKTPAQISEDSEIYYLWSLERVCVALGLRRLDGFDWYGAGARVLLSSQQPDGSWPDQRWGSLPNTCLALLFLRKANLAFELDRVLKLPGARAARGGRRTGGRGGSRARRGRGRGGDVSVLVTGASDAKFPEIAVEFEVKRPDGSFLLDANQADIHVTEDDRPMTILRFQAPTATERMPTTVVLVVDRSLSMEEEDRIGSLKQAVATFMKGLPKGSRVAVVAFGSEVETICPFTSDAQQVQDAVNALEPAGATRYYDAVAEALGMLEKESGRRAVLALTDGEDTFSQTSTLDSVIAAAAAARAAGPHAGTRERGRDREHGPAPAGQRRPAASTTPRVRPSSSVRSTSSSPSGSVPATP